MATTIGALVECGVCYEELPPEYANECDANAGHNVCTECICRYVDEQLTRNEQHRSLLPCIYQKCASRYHTIHVLDKILPADLRVRVNMAMFRLDVEQAAVEWAW